jgi:hypothetical protein
MRLRLVVVLVGDPEVFPDLQIVALGWQAAELGHGVGEVLIPLLWVIPVLHQLPCGLAVHAQHPVGLEQHLVLEGVVVVAVVQDPLRQAHPQCHGVVLGLALERLGLVAHVVVHRRVAPLLQQRCRRGGVESGAVAGVDLEARRGVGEAVHVGREVRHADGVRTREDDELLHGELAEPGVELGLELAEVELRGRERRVSL